MSKQTGSHTRSTHNVIRGKTRPRHGEIRGKRSDTLIGTISGSDVARPRYNAKLAATATMKSRTLKDERLSMRIDEFSKTKLERAAAYHDESVSDYVLTRALQSAEEDISAHEHIALNSPDWNIFFEAFNTPPQPNPRLIALLKHYDQQVISK